MSNPERKSINTVGFKMGGDFAVTAEHLASPANINFEFPSCLIKLIN